MIASTRSACAGLCLGVILTFSTVAASADSIRYDASSKSFELEAGSVSYVFGINERGELQTLHWGGRLADGEVLPAASVGRDRSSFEPTTNLVQQEYPGWGSAFYSEPALKVSFPDGNRDLVLRYVAHTIDGQQLRVQLKDISREVQVELRYELDPASGILGRSARIQNGTRAALNVEHAAAAAWSLPAADDYRLYSLTGRWAGEWELNETKLAPQLTVLESRRGMTGHQNNPWFALGRGVTNEESGPVWFGALAWSGSWRITVEQDQLSRVRVTGGYNPFDFSYRLQPGAAL